MSPPDGTAGSQFRAQIARHRREERVAALGSGARGVNPKDLTVAREDGPAAIRMPKAADVGQPWARRPFRGGGRRRAEGSMILATTACLSLSASTIPITRARACGTNRAAGGSSCHRATSKAFPTLMPMRRRSRYYYDWSGCKFARELDWSPALSQKINYAWPGQRLILGPGSGWTSA